MTTPQSSDGTAKRASTEEESDSNQLKKPRVEDEDDTSMGDESECASDEWEVDTETYFGAKGRASSGSDIDTKEAEPEWGVDSFDEYETDPEARARFATDEEYKEFRDYKIELAKNKWIFAIPNLDAPRGNRTVREYLADLASLCVQKFNEEERKNLEFVSIVRANRQSGGRWKMYITFMAREYPNGPLVEYQAKAMDFAGGKRPPFPILCRFGYVDAALSECFEMRGFPVISNLRQMLSKTLKDGLF